MAATTTKQQEVLPQVPIRILMDKEKKRVLFAEAGKDFVDVLLSFLTLPLGTIARLVGKDSNMEPERVGCLNSLYESAVNLEEERLRPEIFKSMLLQPRNSMESYCRNLKLNIDDTEPPKYFICEDWNCTRYEDGRLLSTFRNLRCHCGKLLNREISPRDFMVNDGFVHETATFIICDDLNVMPNDLDTIVVLLQKLGIEDTESIEEMTVNVGEKEVVDLLKCALLSKTPLTDLFIKKKQSWENFNPRNQSHLEIGEVPTDKEGRKMVVKVLIRKSSGKVLFALGEEDFADLLFSFLTFPLGGVLHMLEGYSSLSCIDKLYKSVTELSADRYLRLQKVKNNLIGEACSPNFYYVDSKDEFEFVTTTTPNDFCSSFIQTVDELLNLVCAPLDFVDLKCLSGETSSVGGFVRGPSTYMVTDDMVVTAASSISGVFFLNKLKVPLSDVETRVINIDIKEGLGILKASLISTSALTNGLHHLIRNIKQEN